jgi:hypothetical protein
MVSHPFSTSFLTEIPKGYQKEWSIEEKMEFLKRANKKFDISQLHELMRIIHKRNQLHYMKNKNIILLKL